MHSEIFKKHGKVNSKVLKADKEAKKKAIHKKLKDKRREIEKDTDDRVLSGMKIFRE